MMFHRCDTNKKSVFHRTLRSSPDFSIVIISNQSASQVKYCKISLKIIICFSLIAILSLGGVARSLFIFITTIKQNAAMRLEENRNQKLTAGLALLDNYLSDLLRNDHTKCEIPKIEIEPYQVSKASLFMIDRSVISDFKLLIQQIDRFSDSFISQKGKDFPKDDSIYFQCPVLGRITSYYGMRTDPVYEGTEKHCGIDIAGQLWSPVFGAAGGQVAFSGWNCRYGNMVVINHGNTGIQTVYAHLQKLSVKKGDRIQAGQQVGYLGSTGKSTGPHLHYEVRLKGRAIDPLPYLLPQNEFPD